MHWVRLRLRRVLQACVALGALLVLLSHVPGPGAPQPCDSHGAYEAQTGVGEGLFRRRVDQPKKRTHKSRVSLDEVGLQVRQSAGLDIQMRSQQNTTLHSWAWPDTHNVLKLCQKEDFLRAGPLANVSVIVTFIDKENISTLLHTVHSIVQRTPEAILKEVILIADNSHNEDLGETLDLYISTVFDKVRLYRSFSTLGLIQARLKGIRLAEAEVVVCMDSHMEVQPGWIEPLLYEINVNPRTLATSALDWMSPIKGGTWEYRHSGSTWTTYFDWNMVFGFQTLSSRRMASRKSPTEPIETPVTVGTIFAIRKSWFTEIGEFDEAMQLWGGENLDLALRAWMCGGRVITVLCSRAAHLEYEHNRDYRNGWSKTIHRNYKRLGLVWMDDYIKYLYQYFPQLENEDVGNVSSRLPLKQKCPHNFKWFLDNVFPELGLPDEDGLAYGGVMHLASGRCLDTRFSLTAGLDECGRPAATSNFYWNKEKELRFPMHIFNAVLETQGRENMVLLKQDEYTSHFREPKKGSRWIHWKDGHIVETVRKLCLEGFAPDKVQLRGCDALSSTQKWRFKNYSENYGKVISGTNSQLAHITEEINYWKNVLR